MKILNNKILTEKVAVLENGGIVPGSPQDLTNYYTKPQDNANLAAAIASIKNGVPTAGDDLNKLYTLIQTLNGLVTGGTPDGDAFVNTIAEVLGIFASYPEGVDLVTALGGKVAATAIVNTLTETASGKVLDARQGKALKDLIDALTTSRGTLSALTTANKTSLVLAINEVNAKQAGTGGTTDIGWKVVGALDGTPEIQALIDALPSTGGAIKLTGQNTLATKLAINKPVMCLGNGMKSTILQTTSGSSDMIEVISSGVKFQDIGFKCNAATPTAGSAIKYTSGNVDNLTNARAFLKLIHCDIDGFFVNADIQEAYGLVIDGCHFSNAYKYDLQLNSYSNVDIGDSIITNSFFIASKNVATEAAIRWNGGGGLKLTGNKFNWYYPYKYKTLIDAIISGTVDFVVTGNSFENYTEKGINIFNGGAFFRNVNITGNQFASLSLNSTIDISLTSVGNINITGNVMENNGITSAAIYLKDCNNALLGNMYYGVYQTNVIYGSGNTAIKEIVNANANIVAGAPLSAPTITATPSANKITLNWTGTSPNASYYQLERSTDQYTWGLVEGFNMPNTIPFDDVTGLVNGTTYYYRSKAIGNNANFLNSPYSAIVSAVATANGNTTPVAPTLVADDVANTLTASHSLGTSEIEVSTNGGAYTAYTGTINVGDVARSAGYWVFRTKAATGRNVSATASSPAFTVAVVTPPPSSSNVLLSESDFTSTSWQDLGIESVTPNATTDPDGTTLADKVTSSSAGGSHGKFQVITKAATSKTYTYKVYAKLDAGSTAGITLDAETSGGSGVYVSYNIATNNLSNSGVFGTGFTLVSTSASNVANGFSEIILVFTTNAETNLSAYLIINAPSNSIYFYKATLIEQ
jgi:hypothetical protein